MNEKGLSLLELLMTTAILAILLFTVGYVFIVGLNLWNEGYARSDIRGDISQAVELISKNLRQAKTRWVHRSIVRCHRRSTSTV